MSRIKGNIRKALRENGDMTVHGIITVFKDRWPRQTPSTSTIASILTKNPEFVMVDVTKSEGTLTISGKYTTVVWGLVE
tara:strand:- start:2967 stop:3203 length:237 start_codon:yes stop_codon:yes gene_type:complete